MLPFFVGEDGRFLRDLKGRELIWDLKTESSMAFEEKRANPALDGSFVTNGKNVKTSFELFKEHVAQYIAAVLFM